MEPVTMYQTPLQSLSIFHLGMSAVQMRTHGSDMKIDVIEKVVARFVHQSIVHSCLWRYDIARAFPIASLFQITWRDVDAFEMCPPHYLWPQSVKALRKSPICSNDVNLDGHACKIVMDIHWIHWTKMSAIMIFDGSNSGKKITQNGSITCSY